MANALEEASCFDPMHKSCRHKAGEWGLRGGALAVGERSAEGGVLGKKLGPVVRDAERAPAKGGVAARGRGQGERGVAFLGGLDTPVSLAIVPFANQSKVPFM